MTEPGCSVPELPPTVARCFAAYGRAVLPGVTVSLPPAVGSVLAALGVVDGAGVGTARRVG